MVQVGRFKIVSVVNGTFRLDGGAMFGVVPKVLWAKQAEPDEENRIPLAMRTLIAVDETSDRVVLVDTGAGHKWSEQEAERFALQPRRQAIAQGLSRFGLSEASVTDVVVTHLHFDHNGGLTEWVDEPGAATRLRFPQARHWLHRRQWEHALAPTIRDQASYLERDLQSLKAEGVLTLVEGDDPPPPWEGMRWMLSHGHTPGQLLPLFEDGSGEPSLLFAGDAIPTSGHLKIAWAMAFDLYPRVMLDEKKRILELCREHGTWLAFPHDPEIGGVVLDLSAGRPIIAHELDL